jgi:DNA mismatch repair ATPase MutS
MYFEFAMCIIFEILYTCIYVRPYIWCQNHDVTDTDAETLTILAKLFLEKATQWFEVVHTINCIDVLRSFAVTSSFSCGTMSRPVIVSANVNKYK